MFHVNSTARPKQVAKDLVRVLKDLGHPQPYSTLLEAVARMYGHASYGMLERAAGGSPVSPDDAAAGPAVADERRKHQVGVLVDLGVPDSAAVQAVAAVSPTGRSRRTSAPAPLSVASEIEFRLARFAGGLAKLGAVPFEHGDWTGVVFRERDMGKKLSCGLAVDRDGRMFMSRSIFNRQREHRFSSGDEDWARDGDAPAEAVTAMKFTLDALAEDGTDRDNPDDYGPDIGELLEECGFYGSPRGMPKHAAGSAKALVDALDREIMIVAAGSPYFNQGAYNELLQLRRTDRSGLFSFMVAHPALNALVTSHTRTFGDDGDGVYQVMKTMGPLSGLERAVAHYGDELGIGERFGVTAIGEVAAVLAKVPLGAIDDIGMFIGHVMHLAYIGGRLAPKSIRDWRCFAHFGWQAHDLMKHGMSLRQVWDGFRGDWNAIGKISLSLHGNHAFRQISISSDFSENLLRAAAREVDEAVSVDDVEFDGTALGSEVSEMVDRLIFGQWSIGQTFDAIDCWYATPNSSGETGTIRGEFGEAERKLLPVRFARLSARETLSELGIENWQDRLFEDAGLSP